MSTAEVPLTPIEPGGPTAPVEPIAPVPARWSTQARGRLIAALILGSLAAVIGALLFFGTPICNRLKKCC